MDMFKFIANCIDLRKMSDASAKALVEHINCVLGSEKEREQIKHSPVFLCVLRKQNRSLTEEMDKKIAEYLSSYYEGTYKLETTEDENQDMPVFVKEYIERIRKSNETQGKDGVYFGHGTCEIATVRSILLGKELTFDTDTMDMLISVVADTLLISKEGISTKLDAIALLICIAVKYPEDYGTGSEAPLLTQQTLHGMILIIAWQKPAPFLPLHFLQSVPRRYVPPRRVKPPLRYFL